MIFILYLSDVTKLKRTILENASYLEEELDVVPILDYLMKNDKISSEQKGIILKQKSRRLRVREFISVITTYFDHSTYFYFKSALGDDNEHILHHIENNEPDKGMISSFRSRKWCSDYYSYGVLTIIALHYTIYIFNYWFELRSLINGA